MAICLRHPRVSLRYRATAIATAMTLDEISQTLGRECAYVETGKYRQFAIWREGNETFRAVFHEGACVAFDSYRSK